VIGGLITSTFLSLLVIPVVFTLVDDLMGLLRRLVRRPVAPRVTSPREVGCGAQGTVPTGNRGDPRRPPDAPPDDPESAGRDLCRAHCGIAPNQS
jgi:hypothetical protein